MKSPLYITKIALVKTDRTITLSSKAITQALWLVVVACGLVCLSYGEKELVYDEEKGIIWVEKDKEQKQKKSTKQTSSALQPQSGVRSRTAGTASSKAEELIVGRAKDPPSVYFKTGLEYFRNGNYENALKNFLHADSLDPQPTYSLWIGKCLRQLERYDQMLVLMNSIINTFPESDVSDDALFEIAFYYQKIEDYEQAMKNYKRLEEQYPFGKSFSNGADFIEIAREQRKIIRNELLTMLNLLGIEGEELNEKILRFQKSRKLPQNGSADRQTVSEIKKAYAEFLNADAQKALSAQRLKKRYKIGQIFAIIIGITLLWIYIMRVKIMANKRHIEELQRILVEMDTKQL